MPIKRSTRPMLRLVAAGAADRVAGAAQLILVIFDDFYGQLCEYPFRAQRAFEGMDPHASIQISKERLGLYTRYIEEHGPRMRAAYPALSSDTGAWDAIDRLFMGMIVARYEADIAFSFAHSLRRNIAHELWRPVAYSFPPPSKLRALSMASGFRRLRIAGQRRRRVSVRRPANPGFAVPFRDLRGDAQRHPRAAGRPLSRRTNAAAPIRSRSTS